MHSTDAMDHRTHPSTLLQPGASAAPVHAHTCGQAGGHCSRPRGRGPVPGAGAAWRVGNRRVATGGEGSGRAGCAREATLAGRAAAHCVEGRGAAVPSSRHGKRSGQRAVLFCRHTRLGHAETNSHQQTDTRRVRVRVRSPQEPSLVRLKPALHVSQRYELQESQFGAQLVQTPTSSYIFGGQVDTGRGSSWIRASLSSAGGRGRRSTCHAWADRHAMCPTTVVRTCPPCFLPTKRGAHHRRPDTKRSLCHRCCTTSHSYSLCSCCCSCRTGRSWRSKTWRPGRGLTGQREARMDQQGAGPR